MSKRGDFACSSCGEYHSQCGPRGRHSTTGRGGRFVDHGSPSNDARTKSGGIFKGWGKK